LGGECSRLHRHRVPPCTVPRLVALCPLRSARMDWQICVCSVFGLISALFLSSRQEDLESTQRGVCRRHLHYCPAQRFCQPFVHVGYDIAHLFHRCTLPFWSMVGAIKRLCAICGSRLGDRVGNSRQGTRYYDRGTPFVHGMGRTSSTVCTPMGALGVCS